MWAPAVMKVRERVWLMESLTNLVAGVGGLALVLADAVQDDDLVVEGVADDREDGGDLDQVELEGEQVHGPGEAVGGGVLVEPLGQGDHADDADDVGEERERRGDGPAGGAESHPDIDREHQHAQDHGDHGLGGEGAGDGGAEVFDAGELAGAGEGIDGEAPLDGPDLAVPASGSVKG
jgi:hypothetical protein